MKYLALASLLLLTGCATLEQRVGPQAAKAVNRYCATLPLEVRRLNRETLNRAIAPNSAAIHCAGDPE